MGKWSAKSDTCRLSDYSFKEYRIMKSVCLYFQVHQPFRLRTYRFFDIGKTHDYFDDYANRFIMQQVAEKCYLPANKVLLNLIKTFGEDFKVSFSISGMAMEQFERYAPKVLESFQALSKTGSVEFLAETYAHSLASLKGGDEFAGQVRMHESRVKKLFGQSPVTFRNTELIYSNEIGDMVFDLGYRTMLTEGAKHVLGWKSPNLMYCSATSPKLKLLLKNFQLSDDIAFRFSERRWSEWPLTAEKFAGWILGLSQKDEVVNLFLDYETFGEHQWAETGIFDFLKAFPPLLIKRTPIRFKTPSELSEALQPAASLNVPYPISWADEERDLTAWLGNEMQDEAFRKLFGIEQQLAAINDPELTTEWRKLQTSDHFYYMCTKWFSDGTVHRYFNPYASPYDAFINYMNVLSDFTIRVEDRYREIPADHLKKAKKKVSSSKTINVKN
jgi:alpha-amylase